MIRVVISLSFFLLGSFSVMYAQPQQIVDSLKRNLENAPTAAEKVKWLGQLSGFYMGVDYAQSNAYAETQLRIAEESRDRKLMILAHFYDAKRHLNFSGRHDNVKTGMQSAERARKLAKDNGLHKMEAWAYLYLSLGHRYNAEYDKALNYGGLALPIATNSDDDSLKVFTYSNLARTYLAKEEKMLAFRNLLQAMDVAESSGSFWLRQMCYKNLAEFYRDIEDFEKAKDLLYKLIAETKTPVNRKYERQDAYNVLGVTYAANKQYDLAQVYFDNAMALADTLNFQVVKLNTYAHMFTMFFESKQYQKAIEFFESQGELKKFMTGAGFSHFIDQAYGMAYTMMGKLDSGYYYLNKAEPAFEKNASRESQYWFYSNMLTHYQRRKNYQKALEYGLRAEQISMTIDDLKLKETIAGSLDSLYQLTGDFKKAYLYNRQQQVYKDSLDLLSQEKDLMALEIENERRQKEKQALVEAQAMRDRHNIQYMGITVAIAAVFIVLVMLGIFSVSHATIRILGFFAFIFLFEFIILIADNQIHHWTHGEPWKVLAIKIGLISLLLPLHHWLEEKVIHYLTTKKLLNIKRDTLFSKILSRKESERVES